MTIINDGGLKLLYLTEKRDAVSLKPTHKGTKSRSRVGCRSVKTLILLD